jgi:hypothetical protein
MAENASWKHKEGQTKPLLKGNSYPRSIMFFGSPALPQSSPDPSCNDQ